MADEDVRAALEAAGTDLIGLEGYFERLGSMGTVASIRRTLAKIDTARAAGEPSRLPGVVHGVRLDR